jgi:GT2 family glycosyltransferase
MIAAVVVTYDRKDLLRECLRAVLAQTRPVDELIVVDNGSRDGTAAMLREEFPQARVVTLTVNEGASGGFYAGMDAAKDREWAWVLDDDTIARPDSLERLLAALDRVPPGPPPVILASRVDWSDGHPHPMNVPIVERRDAAAMVEAIDARLLPVRATTWVSVLIAGAALRRYGLPVRGYFFQADDIEHTARSLRYERGYMVADSVVEHRTRQPHSAVTDASLEKLYYANRNSVHMLRGEAWATSEKPFIAYGIARSSIEYVRAHRSRESLVTMLRAVRDGFRPHDAP